MTNRNYYNRLFEENKDEKWNDAPGKKVILSAFVKLVKNQQNTIIDIGSGNGYFLNEVSKANPVTNYRQHYYGIDISEEAVKKAMKKYSPPIQFFNMDASHLNFGDGFFDVVLSYGVIEHVKKPLVSLKEVQRVLKCRGFFLMMIPSLDYYRTDRNDEGWYEDLDENKQLQWNYVRKSWEKMFTAAGLKLFDINGAKKHGALKEGVFFFGTV